MRKELKGLKGEKKKEKRRRRFTLLELRFRDRSLLDVATATQSLRSLTEQSGLMP
jgi:hypothetical protein